MAPATAKPVPIPEVKPIPDVVLPAALTVQPKPVETKPADNTPPAQVRLLTSAILKSNALPQAAVRPTARAQKIKRIQVLQNGGVIVATTPFKSREEALRNAPSNRMPASVHGMRR